MSKTATPLCPKMLGSLPVKFYEGRRSSHDYPEYTYSQESKCLCRGSACALWVPEYSNGKNETRSSQPFASFDHDGDRVQYIGDGPWRPTGSGWCAENLRCKPWSDPAKENA